MRQSEIAARREYHARRSGQEKAAAGAATSFRAAQRHLALHRLHELECLQLCCTRDGDQAADHRAPSVTSAPHRVILAGTEARLIELSPEQAIIVAELILEKAAEARGDGMLIDEMAARRQRAA